MFGGSDDAGGSNVFGLHTAVNVVSPGTGQDRLLLNGLGGDDTPAADNGMQSTMNGGLVIDVRLGGDGDDVILGSIDVLDGR